MRCAYIRRKLPLYISNDSATRVTVWVRRHLEQCQSCRSELKVLQAFQSRIAQSVVTPPSKILDGFAEEVMQGITRSDAHKTTSGRFVPDGHRAFIRPHFIFVGMFMILSCFALVRQSLLDELFKPQQMKPSVVTQGGAIVSEAQIRGRMAAINVVKDREGMTIIWLNAPVQKTDQARRS